MNLNPQQSGMHETWSQKQRENKSSLKALIHLLHKQVASYPAPFAKWSHQDELYLQTPSQNIPFLSISHSNRKSDTLLKKKKKANH